MSDSVSRQRATKVGLVAGFLMATGVVVADYKSENFDLSKMLGHSAPVTYTGLFVTALFIGGTLGTGIANERRRNPHLMSPPKPK